MATNGSSQATREKPARTASVNLPFVKAQFRAPELHMPRVHTPDRREIGAALRTVGSYLPSPRQAAYYGGLALMAAFEVIEWPVAAAIGVGTALAKGGDAGTSPSREGDSSAQEHQARQRETASGSAARTRSRAVKK